MGFRTHRLLSTISHVPIRHLGKDLPDHHALSHRQLRNLDSRGFVGETDRNLLVIVSMVETERIALDGLGEMTGIMTDARSRDHAQPQNGAHPIVLIRNGITSPVIDRPESVAIAAV